MLGFGRKALAIPGPTTVPDEVLQAMHRPAIDIYADELVALTDGLREDLKRVFRLEDGKTAIYIANGHGAWEAALANTMSAGDQVLSLAAGRFGVGWAEMAEQMGLAAELLESAPRAALDPEAVEARLRADVERRIKAVLTVQIDTASGAVTDIPAIRAAMDAAGHPALLMVDGVASIGCMPFEMSRWGVDVALTGSQKGLMTPPGLSFLGIGPKAWEISKQAGLRTRYWDWIFRDGPVHYFKYCGTAPEHLLFGLRRALDMLLDEEGLDAAWTRHRVLAEATWDALDAWAEGGALEPHILRRADRGATVTPTRLTEKAATSGITEERLRAFTAEQCGLSLGAPLGALYGPSGGFRIAHMGHQNAVGMLGVLGTLEASLAALGCPLGPSSGVAAAARRMAEALRPAA